MSLFWRAMLILLAFVLGGGQMMAAGTRQERAFMAAKAAFDAEMWSRAEAECAAFAAKYPDSASMPMVRLLQAQAEIKQGDYTNAIQVLALNQIKAGKLADQYVNWIGEAQYADGNFPAAADTFTALAQNFTNSPLRLSATVSAAAALAQLDQWPRVEFLLEPSNGVFQAGLRADADSPLVLRGQLLRAQAKVEHKDYSAAAAILESKKLDTLPPDLAWPWVYWLCETRSKLEDLPAALSDATRLVQIATDARDDERLAESLTLRAGLYEQSHMTNEALADYEENLANANTPAEIQAKAVLKTSGLLTARNQFSDAEIRLNTFLEQFPHSPAAATALFSLGDLHLRHYAADGSLTNLQLAQACLDQFLSVYTNSDDLGHAYLDRGWCGWFATNYVAAAADFQQAVEHLPRSWDLAVAHFKLGDALFMENDFTNALDNYRVVLDDFMGFPDVEHKLDEQALYQSLRVGLSMTNATAASAALARILKMYPAGDLSDNATMFFGQSQVDAGRPRAAREVFRRFIKQFPDSELLPQAELALAQSYEQQTKPDWTAAITNYESWLRVFPTNDLRAEVIYAEARAYYQAGEDTNALAEFTSFITQFPTNKLAPQAQWWVADYFYRAGNFAGAETNYENIYQNPAWKNSTLNYWAQFMAGRAAMARNGYPDATRYFSALISDTNCPPDVGVPARFACAAAWMQIPSADTNNPVANFATAITFLSQIIQINPTNDAAARAWGEIGNCEFQMSNYDAAENAYAQVFGTNAPAAAAADVSVRSAAGVGYGLVLEKRAESATGADQTNLLQQALGQYLDVFDTNLGENLRPGETADPYWVKKAGLQALPLIQSLGYGNPDKFIDQLERMLPSLKSSLEKTRLSLASKR